MLSVPDGLQRHAGAELHGAGRFNNRVDTRVAAEDRGAINDFCASPIGNLASALPRTVEHSRQAHAESIMGDLVRDSAAHGACADEANANRLVPILTQSQSSVYYHHFFTVSYTSPRSL